MFDKISTMKLPLILALEITLCLTLGHLVPHSLKEIAYTISYTIIDVLMTVLPFIIFAFITKSISDLGKGALSFIGLVFLLVCTSNFVSTGLGGFLGSLTLQNIGMISKVSEPATQLLPIWTATLPKLISNDAALFTGVAAGLLISTFRLTTVKTLTDRAQKIAGLFLSKIFIPVIPIFVLGFIFKIETEEMLETILQDYSGILAAIIFFAASYVALLYALSAPLKSWWNNIKNMIPAALTGFSTMSSASAMPLIIQGSEKNCIEPKTVKGVTPMVINIHLLGDCFAIPILALAIMMSFGHELPSFTTYLTFTSYYVIAKFAVAAVPGGGVLVMLPILKQYLGFTPEMCTLITTLYILFDPLVTSINTLGNGAFNMIFSRIYRVFMSKAAHNPVA